MTYTKTDRFIPPQGCFTLDDQTSAQDNVGEITHNTLLLGDIMIACMNVHDKPPFIKSLDELRTRYGLGAAYKAAQFHIPLMFQVQQERRGNGVFFMPGQSYRCPVEIQSILKPLPKSPSSVFSKFGWLTTSELSGAFEFSKAENKHSLELVLFHTLLLSTCSLDEAVVPVLCLGIYDPKISYSLEPLLGSDAHLVSCCTLFTLTTPHT